MSDLFVPQFGRRRSEMDEAPAIPLFANEAPAPSVVVPPPAGEASSAARSMRTRSEIADLREICLARMDATAVASLPPERLLIEVERLVADIATDQHINLNGREQRQLATELVDDMVGLGPLEPLLEDESITDIMVNGYERVFVERKGKLVQVPVNFRDNAHVTNICQRIAASIGRRVDEASPMVDARLKDGSRVNIILPPLSIDGPAISIRKFAKKAIDFEKLVQFGTMTAPVARILEVAARCRLNVIISGGTGSGKTTLLNAMSRFIDADERIVTVEDAAELQLQQPHVVRLETRPRSLEGKGEVTARDLVRNALRMRPDRIIIGEVRGSEAFDMLQAMNTGHDGSMSTIHANTTRDALARIENMVQMASMGLTMRAIRTQVVSAVNIIVQVERQRDGGRRLVQLTEICGMEGDTPLLNDIFKFELDGEGTDGKLHGHYVVNRIRSQFFERLQYFGLDRAWNVALEQAAL